MAEEDNKAIFRRYIGMWETGDISRLDEIIGDQYVGHVADGERDLNGLKMRIQLFQIDYLNAAFTIDDQVADGDRVATRITLRGIFEASGQPRSLIGLNLSRFVGGKIVEEWAVWETLRAR